MAPSVDNISGGVPTPTNLSEPRSGISKDDEPEGDTGVLSSSHPTSSHGKTTLALRQSEGSASTGVGKPSSGDREGRDEKSQQDQLASGADEGSSGDKAMYDEHGTETNSDGTKSGSKVMKEYSAEARTYHAFYDELQRAHLRGHYTWCRDNCMKFLAMPRIPLWTRIQTLQLLSTMFQAAGGGQCLEEAEQLIDKLDPNQFQTQLLREDNRKMKADRMDARMKKDMVGKDMDGVGDTARADEQLKLDCELDEKLRQELELDRELDEKLGQELEE